MYDDLKSGPVDHDKQDLWFIASCGLLTVVVGVVFWMLGLM